MRYLTLKCCSCGTFLVQAQTKSGKFVCRMCGRKQSIVKRYATSERAADCRSVAMKLNMRRGQAEQARQIAALEAQFASDAAPSRAPSDGPDTPNASSGSEAPRETAASSMWEEAAAHFRSPRGSVSPQTTSLAEPPEAPGPSGSVSLLALLANRGGSTKRQPLVSDAVLELPDDVKLDRKGRVVRTHAGRGRSRSSVGGQSTSSAVPKRVRVDDSSPNRLRSPKRQTSGSLEVTRSISLSRTVAKEDIARGALPGRPGVAGAPVGEVQRSLPSSPSAQQMAVAGQMDGADRTTCAEAVARSTLRGLESAGGSISLLAAVRRPGTQPTLPSAGEFVLSAE